MINGKRGSHVGVILSFVIFIGFLVFMYPLLIQPTINVKNDKQYLLDNLKSGIISQSSSLITSLSINTASAPQECIRLNNFVNNSGLNSKIVIKNKNGENQIGYIIGNDLEIIRSNSNDTFFRIYNSTSFSSLNDTGQTPCNQVNYDNGATRTESYVTESKIKNLISQYEDNYTNLKDSLQLPEGDEFDFTFTYSNKTTIGVKNDLSTNIYAEESPVQYTKNDGGISVGKINVRIW